MIEAGAYAKEVRRIVRAVRVTMGLRRKLNASVLSAFLEFAVSPGSELHSRFSSYLPKVKSFFLLSGRREGGGTEFVFFGFS